MTLHKTVTVLTRIPGSNQRERDKDDLDPSAAAGNTADAAAGARDQQPFETTTKKMTSKQEECDRKLAGEDTMHGLQDRVSMPCYGT